MEKTGGVIVLLPQLPLLVMKAFEKLNWILDFVTIYSNQIARAQIVRAVDSSTLFQILLAYVSSVHQLASQSVSHSVRLFICASIYDAKRIQGFLHSWNISMDGWVKWIAWRTDGRMAVDLWIDGWFISADVPKHWWELHNSHYDLVSNKGLGEILHECGCVGTMKGTRSA